jgi:hypothetical protein
MYRPTTREDCLYLADHLRPEDVSELEAGGYTPALALLFGLKNSTLCLTLIDPKTNLPGAIVGVGPSRFDKVGQIWLLGSKAIENNSVTFVRNSKKVLDVLFEASGYEALYNYTHKPNTLHHKWLKWLGFVFLREMKRLPKDEPFYEFVRLKD